MKAALAEGGERVEGYPEVLQAVEVVKGVSGDPADGGFLDAQFGGVRGKVLGDISEFWVIAQDAPKRTDHYITLMFDDVKKTDQVRV